MNKKIAAALSGAATLMLAVSGCGSSGGGDDKVGSYAKAYCDKVQSQVQKFQDASNSIASVAGGDHKPEEVKNTDSTAFQQMSDAFKGFADAVDSVGAPPVDNGASVQQNAVKQLNAAAASYANLKKTVDGLDTGDQGKFAQGLQTLTSQLSAVSKVGDDALNKIQSGALGQAMAKQPGCQKPSGSPSEVASQAPSTGASQGAGQSSAAPRQSASAPAAKPSARAGAGSPSPSGSSSAGAGSALGG